MVYSTLATAQTLSNLKGTVVSLRIWEKERKKGNTSAYSWLK